MGNQCYCYANHNLVGHSDLVNGVVSYAKKEYEDILRHHQILGSNSVSLMNPLNA